MKAEEQVMYTIGVSSGLCKHLRTCEQCINFACKSSDQISRVSNKQVASSEHFVNFSLGGISLLFKKKIFHRVIWLTPFNH